MNIISTSIKGVYKITLRQIKDDRGSFMRAFCKDELKEAGLDLDIVQINQSNSANKGTFRGLHFQHKPYSEKKLIRCIRGEVLDIIVDLRKDSDTFLQSLTFELSESKSEMLLVPEGIAHGFQTLCNNAQLLYLHTNYYNPDYEDGIRYDDPKLDIKLPLAVSSISERDLSFGLLDDNFKGI